MEMLGRIRRMYLRDKVSLHEITKRTGLSRNTVRRWLRTPQEVQVPTYSRAAGFGKLSGFIAELEQSLKADALRPKRDRRTGRALFAQIKASGYAGGYTRVTDYIRAWRASAGKDVKAFVPLKFDLGEAFQFDWSVDLGFCQEGLVVGGIYHRMQVSHMKLCASRAFWLVAYPSQGHEMLFDAHIRPENKHECLPVDLSTPSAATPDRPQRPLHRQPLTFAAWAGLNDKPLEDYAKK